MNFWLSGRFQLNYLYLSVAVGLTIILSGCLLGKIPFPNCPFEQFFHFCCPMCGSTRASLSLLHTGDLWTALRFNPIFWLWGFWCGIAYVDLWIRAFSQHRPSIGESCIQSLANNKTFLKFHLGLSLGTLLYLNLPITVAWRVQQFIP